MTGRLCLNEARKGLRYFENLLNAFNRCNKMHIKTVTAYHCSGNLACDRSDRVGVASGTDGFRKNILKRLRSNPLSTIKRERDNVNHMTAEPANRPISAGESLSSMRRCIRSRTAE